MSNFADRLTELLKVGNIYDVSGFLVEHTYAIRDLVRAAEKRAVHYNCEDTWYSCPKSSDGCADERQTECNCGADEMIAALAKLEEA